MTMNNDYVGVGIDCVLTCSHVDCVFSLAAYEADLGMKTRLAVRRQLDVDLPRSLVHVQGKRVLTSPEVLRATSHPKLCTQAVLAPVVEWYLNAQIVAYDAREPMHVSIDYGGTQVQIVKKLGLRTWSGHILGTAHVTMVADAVHNSLVIHVKTEEWGASKNPMTMRANSTQLST